MLAKTDYQSMSGFVRDDVMRETSEYDLARKIVPHVLFLSFEIAKEQRSFVAVVKCIRFMHRVREDTQPGPESAFRCTYVAKAPGASKGIVESPESLAGDRIYHLLVKTRI